MKTEADARKTRCFRLQSPSMPRERAMCITTACMAWRWAEAEVPRKFIVDLEANADGIEPPNELTLRARSKLTIPSHYTWRPADDAEGDPPGWIEPEHEATARRHGYCGACDKPDYW